MTKQSEKQIKANQKKTKTKDTPKFSVTSPVSHHVVSRSQCKQSFTPSNFPEKKLVNYTDWGTGLPTSNNDIDFRERDPIKIPFSLEWTFLFLLLCWFFFEFCLFLGDFFLLWCQGLGWRRNGTWKMLLSLCKICKYLMDSFKTIELLMDRPCKITLQWNYTCCIS